MRRDEHSSCPASAGEGGPAAHPKASSAVVGQERTPRGWRDFVLALRPGVLIVVRRPFRHDVQVLGQRSASPQFGAERNLLPIALELGRRGEGLGLAIVVGLGLCWRHIADPRQQSAVLESVDPAERR